MRPSVKHKESTGLPFLVWFGFRKYYKRLTKSSFAYEAKHLDTSPSKMSDLINFVVPRRFFQCFPGGNVFLRCKRVETIAQ